MTARLSLFIVPQFSFFFKNFSTNREIHRKKGEASRSSFSQKQKNRRNQTNVKTDFYKSRALYDFLVAFGASICYNIHAEKAHTAAKKEIAQYQRSKRQQVEKSCMTTILVPCSFPQREGKTVLSELKREWNRARTENGALTLKTSESGLVDLFATVGALRHRSADVMIKRFRRAYAEDPSDAMRILFFGRDIREGLGERKVFRTVLRDLAFTHPQSVEKNLAYIAEYGRYDDLLVLLDTPLESKTAEYLKQCFFGELSCVDGGEKPTLLAKWMPSVNASSRETVRLAKKLAKHFGMSDAEYRRALSRLRAELSLTENAIRTKDYSFAYEGVPSRAMMKYREAFYRRDGERFDRYLEGVSRHKTKMNTMAIEPYEIVEKVTRHEAYAFGYIDRFFSPEERRMLDTMWKALPCYTTDENALVVVDASGSMYGSRDPMPISVAISLGLYFAERNRGAFHNHFISFSRNPELVEVKGFDIVEKIRRCMSMSDPANTSLERVFSLILSAAIRNRVPQSELPTRLYIVSDMEFDACVTGRHETNYQNAKRRFEEAGYRLPQVIFWNVDSRHMTQPVRMDENGTALVSGFTPRLFGMMLQGEISPAAMMYSVIRSERYAPIGA